jgi:hypothetical protein
MIKSEEYYYYYNDEYEDEEDCKPPYPEGTLWQTPTASLVDKPQRGLERSGEDLLPGQAERVTRWLEALERRAARRSK